MKILNTIRQLILCWAFLLMITGCQKKIITEFGFDAVISGKVVDQAGNVVAGDITSANLVVKALGDGDLITTDMRVKGDGTYQNTKLFPKKYRVWISGPVTQAADTLRVDLAQEKVINNDFIVVPFITINTPAVVGNLTDTSADISYKIIANNGNKISKRELYCSTVPYANASTGSGPNYTTNKVTLNVDAGNVSIKGLTKKTRYFIRIGAQATGAAGINYSGQIEITTN